MQTAYALSRYGAWFGGMLIVLAAFIVGIDVVLRKAFDFSLGGADMLSGYALAIGSAWGFSFALLERAHVRIDSLYVMLPKPFRAVLDIVGLLAFTLFMMLVAWHGYGVFRQSVDLGARSLSPLGTPVMIPQFIWFLGLVVFVLIALFLLSRATILFVTGNIEAAHRLIGSRSVMEDLEEELRHQQRREDM